MVNNKEQNFILAISPSYKSTVEQQAPADIASGVIQSSPEIPMTPNKQLTRFPSYCDKTLHRSARQWAPREKTHGS